MLLFSFISVFILIFSNSDQNIISTQTSDQHQSSFFILTFNLCSLCWGIISALHKAGWVHCHIYKYSPSSHMHTPLRARAHTHTHTHTHTGFLQEEEKNWNKQTSMTNFLNWAKNSPSARKPSIQCKKKPYHLVTVRSTRAWKKTLFLYLDLFFFHQTCWVSSTACIVSRKGIFGLPHWDSLSRTLSKH